MNLRTGTTINQYKIISEIRKGGQGRGRINKLKFVGHHGKIETRFKELVRKMGIPEQLKK